MTYLTSATPLPLSASPPLGSKFEGDSDRDLMVQVSQGSHQALGELLDRHWTALVRYALRFVNDRDGAEDVVQEAYVRLWERRGEWVPRGSPRAYLYRIVRNLVLQEREKRAVRKRWREGQAAISQIEPPSSDLIYAEALRGKIDSAIQALPPRRQEILVLARFHDLSYKQIAEVMGISPQTVANQMSAAFRELRESLAIYRP